MVCSLIKAHKCWYGTYYTYISSFIISTKKNQFCEIVENQVPNISKLNKISYSRIFHNLDIFPQAWLTDLFMFVSKLCLLRQTIRVSFNNCMSKLWCMVCRPSIKVGSPLVSCGTTTFTWWWHQFIGGATWHHHLYWVVPPQLCLQITHFLLDILET